MSNYSHLLAGLPVMLLIVVVAMLVVIIAMAMDALFGWRSGWRDLGWTCVGSVVAALSVAFCWTKTLMCWSEHHLKNQSTDTAVNGYCEETMRRFTDAVHPKTIGYKQWGYAFYCKIRAFLAGNL